MSQLFGGLSIIIKSKRLLLVAFTRGNILIQ